MYGLGHQIVDSCLRTQFGGCNVVAEDDVGDNVETSVHDDGPNNVPRWLADVPDVVMRSAWIDRDNQ